MCKTELAKIFSLAKLLNWHILIINATEDYKCRSFFLPFWGDQDKNWILPHSDKVRWFRFHLEHIQIRIMQIWIRKSFHCQRSYRHHYIFTQNFPCSVFFLFCNLIPTVTWVNNEFPLYICMSRYRRAVSYFCHGSVPPWGFTPPYTINKNTSYRMRIALSLSLC